MGDMRFLSENRRLVQADRSVIDRSWWLCE